jgi:hypothetical protein
VPPAALIAITFTTTAAAALRERVAGVLGSPARERQRTGTELLAVLQVLRGPRHLR